MNVAAITGILSLITLILGIAAIIYKVGKSEKVKEQDTQRIDKLLQVLDEHCKNGDIHVNQKLADHLLTQQTATNQRMESKLDELLRAK